MDKKFNNDEILKALKTIKEHYDKKESRERCRSICLHCVPYDDKNKRTARSCIDKIGNNVLRCTMCGEEFSDEMFSSIQIDDIFLKMNDLTNQMKFMSSFFNYNEDDGWDNVAVYTLDTYEMKKTYKRIRNLIDNKITDIKHDKVSSKPKLEDDNEIFGGWVLVD